MPPKLGQPAHSTNNRIPNGRTCYPITPLLIKMSGTPSGMVLSAMGDIEARAFTVD